MSIKSIKEYFKSVPKNVIQFAFEAMEQAEEVIEEEARKLELEEGDLTMADYVRTEVFQYLSPREELFRGLDWELYRSHCRELIARMTDINHSWRPVLEAATDAECLSALASASLKTPPSHDAYLLIGRLFLSVFGDDKFEEVFGDDKSLAIRRNPVADDLLVDVRRKLTVRCRDSSVSWKVRRRDKDSKRNKGRKGGA